MMRSVLLAKEGAKSRRGRTNFDSVVKRPPLRLLKVKVFD